MKTIFVTSFNPFISRNILETDVLKKLRKKNDLRIVIFVPDYKKDYFVKNFESETVIIEGVKELPVRRQDIIFRYLAGSLIDTKTRLLHHKRKLFADSNYLHFFFSRLLAKIFSRLFFIKNIVRFFDSLSIKKDYFEPFFKKYKPVLLFSTDIFHNSDIHFLAEAKKNNIDTVSMVRSWDNVTNKGLFRIKPDRLIVHNNIIKDEVIKYEGVKDKDIFISGMPQLDHYVLEPRLPREEFFKKIGFESSCKLIFFGPLGKRFIETDWQILEILKMAIRQKLIPNEVRFIVRLPPNDKVALEKFIPDSHFFIHETGVPFKEDFFSDREVTMKEEITLADSLYHSDLVIVYASSLIIDAAVFNKPIVCISFDGFEKKIGLSSADRFIKYYDHSRKMLETGCCKIVGSKDDLIEGINIYLKNPKLDQVGRADFALKQAYKLDGQAGARIARFLFSILNSSA